MLFCSLFHKNHNSCVERQHAHISVHMQTWVHEDERIPECHLHLLKSYFSTLQTINTLEGFLSLLIVCSFFFSLVEGEIIMVVIWLQHSELVWFLVRTTWIWICQLVIMLPQYCPFNVNYRQKIAHLLSHISIHINNCAEQKA